MPCVARELASEGIDVGEGDEESPAAAESVGATDACAAPHPSARCFGVFPYQGPTRGFRRPPFRFQPRFCPLVLRWILRSVLPLFRWRMKPLSQHDCNHIAAKLNTQPRKWLGYRTPEECYEP